VPKLEKPKKIAKRNVKKVLKRKNLIPFGEVKESISRTETENSAYDPD